jgi:hypothetical protein
MRRELKRSRMIRMSVRFPYRKRVLDVNWSIILIVLISGLEGRFAGATQAPDRRENAAHIGGPRR